MPEIFYSLTEHLDEMGAFARVYGELRAMSVRYTSIRSDGEREK